MIKINKFNKKLLKQKNDNTLISILLATFNHENFIIECLNSIKDQTYSEFEIIISDDCSSDKTLEKINKFKLSNHKIKIKLFKQKKNLGISKNYNFLFSKARGKYIIFFGGDDVMHRDKLQLQVSALQNNPFATFTFSNCAWYNSTISIKLFNHFGLIQKVPKKVIDILSDNSIPSCTMMINSKFLKKKPLDERLKYFSDFILVINLFIKSRPIYIDKILVKYRRHSGSIMIQKNQNNERLIIIKILKKKFKNNKLYLDQINKFKSIYFHYKIYEEMESNKPSFKLIKNSLGFLFKNPKWFLRNLFLTRYLLLLFGKKIKIF